MERIKNQGEKSIIYFEHNHRYQWASTFASGVVLDVACGIGYGSQIILENKDVNGYIGVDVSEDSLEIAKNNFQDDKRISFELSNMEKLPLADSSINTAISLETLEHVDDVDNSIAEISRVLVEDGIFLGSVPTDKMEQRCREVYGENKFHKRMFTRDDIKRALEKKFKYVHIGRVNVVIGSLFDFEKDETNCDNSSIEINNNNQMGSFLFVASNKSLDDQAKFYKKFVFAMDFIEQDAEATVPLSDAYKKAEDLVIERDKYIKRIEDLVIEKDKYIKKLEQRIPK